jgi:L-threonylcarbamoyladenylate synthase
MSAQIGSDIAYAAALLEAGEVVAIPTETVYGLAANAFDPQAIAKIYEIKRRPRFNPLILHTDRRERVERWTGPWPAGAMAFAERFWPGPLTLLLPRGPEIPDLATAGQPRVAFRVPALVPTQELLRRLPFPLAAPSANPSGYVSPTSAAHVAAQLGEQIPYILDFGPASLGLESSIVGFGEDGLAELYRPGGLAVEAIEAICGPLRRVQSEGRGGAAPGMLSSHYAPGPQVLLGNIAQRLAELPAEQVGILSFSTDYPEIPARRKWLLSPSGDLAEAAQRLFAGLRHLDQPGIAYILAEEVPDSGLGLAINDRLRRAAAERP